MTVVKTSRFTLRPIQMDDAPRLAELCNDLDIARNTSRIPHPYTLNDAEGFAAYAIEATAAGKEYPYAVCRNDVIIACAGVMPHEENAYELGYWVGAKYRGIGVATEASDAMLQFACAVLKPQTLTSAHFTDNPASGNVLAKLGFKPTGVIDKMNSLGRGEPMDTVRLKMSAPAFKPLETAKIIHPPYE